MQRPVPHAQWGNSPRLQRITAVDRVAQCADNSADHFLGHADAGTLAGTYNRSPFCNAIVAAQQNDANGLCLQVLDNAPNTCFKFYQLAVHSVLHTEYRCDTVTHTTTVPVSCTPDFRSKSSISLFKTDMISLAFMVLMSYPHLRIRLLRILRMDARILRSYSSSPICSTKPPSSAGFCFSSS